MGEGGGDPMTHHHVLWLTVGLVIGHLLWRWARSVPPFRRRPAVRAWCARCGRGIPPGGALCCPTPRQEGDA